MRRMHLHRYKDGQKQVEHKENRLDRDRTFFNHDVGKASAVTQTFYVCTE